MYFCKKKTIKINKNAKTQNGFLTCETQNGSAWVCVGRGPYETRPFVQTGSGQKRKGKWAQKRSRCGRRRRGFTAARLAIMYI